ncbi:hypothetical protein FB451DRAFT_1189666 [Mycena latifolia]|nr:hypothetical protein FB451DRAFT_1189666 [Mycena latifolia]
MPTQPTLTQIRFNNIVTCLDAAVATLEAMARSLETPFLEAISTTIRSLLITVETINQNRKDCTQMLEQIHQLLTLHKIHTFVEAQQEKSRIKQFFRQGEMNTLLKACQEGLHDALEVFKLHNVHALSDIAGMQQHAHKTHQEVLELISVLSDGASFDRQSSMSRVLSSFRNSSNSLSLLPSECKIFHGRESEVSTIIKQFSQQIPRIAILGAGGMGKTSLARAVLHHPEITARYNQHRVFVACDTATSSIQLAALIGVYLGLNPGKDFTQPVIHYFSNSSPSLLILDNLETVWEPRESRTDVEKFLCLLADISHLALIVTMRGAERPANVQWSHPFLGPLKPLTQEAARRTVLDIVDSGYPLEDIDKVLSLTDNMPLAIDLIAHAMDYEGASSVLNRWGTEKTALLSEGYDKGSNLDSSILLSLESPRLTSMPQSRDLLSLLSMLPDGLADADLIQSNLPLENILACKAALLQTSLAYTDDKQRLRVLLPIREFVKTRYPPRAQLVQAVIKHFFLLLEIHESYHGTVSSHGLVTRIESNFSNIGNILMHSLNQTDIDRVNIIYSICHFDRFSRQTKHGRSQLIYEIPNLMPRRRDHRLEVYFIIQLLGGHLYHPVPNAPNLVAQALECLPHFDDTALKCRFYNILADYYRFRDVPRAIQAAQDGWTLSISTEDTKQQHNLLNALAWIQWQIGDHPSAQVNAHEAWRLAKISGNLYREAQALRLQSICWETLGRYNRCIPLLRTAQDRLRLCGMADGDLDHFIMNNLAEVHRVRSEYVDARNIQTQLLRVSVNQGAYDRAVALINIAQIDVETGASQHDIQENVHKATTLFSEISNSMGTAYSDMILAALAAREGDLLTAKKLFQQALSFTWGKDADTVSYCLEGLAHISTTWNTWPVIFLCHSLKLKRKREIHKALQFQGEQYLADGDQQTALSLFTVALEGFTQMDIHRSRAECMLRLGDISKEDGDILKAAELWKAARPLFQRSSQTHQIAYVDERLAGIAESNQSLY